LHKIAESPRDVHRKLLYIVRLDFKYELQQLFRRINTAESDQKCAKTSPPTQF
jgi:hypothetical protein